MTVRRHYIETTDVSGSTEAIIGLAEELIDRYVGPQPKFMRIGYQGVITALSNSDKTIADTSTTSQLYHTNGQFTRAVLEMLSGAAAGKRAVIESSDKDNKTVTLRSALAATPAVGDYFKIYQLAQFPRVQDVYSTPDGLNIMASIPEAVREATIAQAEFIVSKGLGYFTGEGSDLQSESFLNYSYTRTQDSADASALTKLVSPQARTLLRGIVNRRGTLNTGPGYVSKYPV